MPCHNIANIFVLLRLHGLFCLLPTLSPSLLGFKRRGAILEDEQYLWVVCFAPGVLGTFLSLCSCCRNGHLKCKSTVDEEDDAEEEDSIPRGPHACALPAHILLLLLVVISLGMHSSAMLYCEVGIPNFNLVPLT